jgi:hypothetical protein
MEYLNTLAIQGRVFANQGKHIVNQIWLSGSGFTLKGGSFMSNA